MSTREQRSKYGSGREYSAEEIALFARYRDRRVMARPQACLGGEDCWVELGPPGMAMNKLAACNKCRGCPRILRIDPATPP